MTAVGELVLVLGLLVSAHCEVRARDPEVEEEEEGGGGGEGGLPLHPGATETPPLREMGNSPDRTGFKLSKRPRYRSQKISTNLLWCCCPGHGGHNCKDTVSDALLDFGGSTLIGRSEPERADVRAAEVQARLQQSADPNRQQNDNQATVSTPYDHQHNATDLRPGHAPLPHQAPQYPSNPHDHHTPHQHDQHHQRDQHHQHHQRDQHHQHHQRDQHHQHHQHDQHHQHHQHDQHHQHHQRDQQQQIPDDGAVPPTTFPYPEAPTAPAYPEAPAPLPVPHMMALVMSQLQPLFQGFNRSLEQLNQQVVQLSRDVAELKSSQLGAEPLEEAERDEGAEGRLESKLEEVVEQVREVRVQMERQCSDMENRLHSQHAMLHYNLTGFKTDIDMKLKRHHKMLQVSLQAMNVTLIELRSHQEQIAEEELEELLPPPLQPPQRPPSDTSALWEAVERLDNMVVNNTVKVGGLTEEVEEVEEVAGGVQQLWRQVKEVEKQMNQTARRSQVLFMETGLEVEDAKVAVLRRVEELVGNLTQRDQRLQEMDVDVDYLYTALYRHNASDCDCTGLKAAVARLERGVANVTELANENRLALDENSEGGAGQWGGASDWEPVVEALQHGLQQVKESVASEQTRTRTLELGLTRLNGSLSDPKEPDEEQAKMKHLAASFGSLLEDAIRHSEVLELLLGEEVLEFLDWPVPDQEAHSIPALKEQLRLLQEALRGHGESVMLLRGSRERGREEVPSADQPSSSSSLHPPSDDWLPGGSRRSGGGVPARERQLLLRPDGGQLGGDGGDLWNLEKTVEELERRLVRLEERPRPDTSAHREAPPAGVEAKLQAEVTWLKRGLEEHLRMFKNVFSNADVVAAADATLELDKLWQLLKNKEKKRGGGERRREGGGREEGRGGHPRSRRESPGVSPDQSAGSLLFVAGSPLDVSDGVIVFKPSENRGGFYSDAGVFTPPVFGFYQFVLTLDLRPGPAHLVLRGQEGVAHMTLQKEVTEAGPVTVAGSLLLREGEEVWAELTAGKWAETERNVFSVRLLLNMTT